MAKGFTQAKSAEYRRLQAKSKVRGQLRELVTAREFYINSRSEYRQKEFTRLDFAIEAARSKLQ